MTSWLSLFIRAVTNYENKLLCSRKINARAAGMGYKAAHECFETAGRDGKVFNAVSSDTERVFWSLYTETTKNHKLAVWKQSVATSYTGAFTYYLEILKYCYESHLELSSASKLSIYHITICPQEGSRESPSYTQSGMPLKMLPIWPVSVILYMVSRSGPVV